MSIDYRSDSLLPPGASDRDDYFDLPSGQIGAPKMENYFIVDAVGELVTEEGLSEREAVATKQFFRENGVDAPTPLKVVRRDRLSPVNQAKIAALEDAVKAATARLIGKVA